MRITVCDDCRQDTCAVRDLLPGQEIKLYDSAKSLLVGKLRTRDEAAAICFTVSMYHVREFAGMELTFADEREKLPASRRYYAAVQERCRKIMFEEVEWE